MPKDRIQEVLEKCVEGKVEKLRFRPEIVKQRKSLIRRLLPIETLGWNRLCDEVRASGWPKIDLSFLESQTTYKRPVWVVFPIWPPKRFDGVRLHPEKGVYWIVTGEYSNDSFKHDHPVFNHYGSAAHWSRRGGDRLLYPTPEILLPEKVRDLCHEAADRFGQENVLLIMEADPKMWQKDLRKRVRVDWDPLIVGYVPRLSQAYLITFFDPSPREVYVLNEFVEGKVSRG